MVWLWAQMALQCIIGGNGKDDERKQKKGFICFRGDDAGQPDGNALMAAWLTNYDTNLQAGRTTSNR